MSCVVIDVDGVPVRFQVRGSGKQLTERDREAMRDMFRAACKAFAEKPCGQECRLRISGKGRVGPTKRAMTPAQLSDRMKRVASFRRGKKAANVVPNHYIDPAQVVETARS